MAGGFRTPLFILGLSTAIQAGFHGPLPHTGISGTSGAAVNALTADDLQSTSEVNTATIAQTHALTADDLQSTSQVSTPDVDTEQDLLADDLQSVSEVDTATIAQTHALTADDLQSTSEVDTVALGVIRNLLADNLESASEVSSPTYTNVFVLHPVGIESGSEVSSPNADNIKVYALPGYELAPGVGASVFPETQGAGLVQATTGAILAPDGTAGCMAEPQKIGYGIASERVGAELKLTVGGN